MPDAGAGSPIFAAQPHDASHTDAGVPKLTAAPAGEHEPSPEPHTCLSTAWDLEGLKAASEHGERASARASPTLVGRVLSALLNGRQRP